MLAVTDEPDAPREARPLDRSYGRSGWLAAALSGSEPPASEQPGATPAGSTAPDGVQSHDAAPDAPPQQPGPPEHHTGHAHEKPHHLARRLRRRRDVPGTPDDTAPHQPGGVHADPHVAGSGPGGQRHVGPHAASPASAGQGRVEPLAPGAGSAAPVSTGADTPERPLSPLGAPPMPATPTGVVRWWTAGSTLAAAALLSVAAFAGVGPLGAAVLLVVAVAAWGWPTLVDLPSPRGSTTTVALGGAACVVAVALSRDEPLLQWLALALAGAVVGEFVHQLARRDGRPRLVEGVTGTLAGVVVLASMSALLALPRTPVEAGGVLLVVVPAAIGLALQALPVPGRLSSVAGVGVAALLAGLVANFLEPTVLAGLVTGLATGAVAVMLHRLLSVLPPAGSAPAWLAVALAPLASTGMVGYVALRLLVG
jgi:hypothetical protein